MKQTTIPAQITTVEDKIAGSLNFTQIILLLSSLLLATFIYTVLPEKMQMTSYKIPLVIVEFFVFAGLSIRVREKIILSWIIVLLRYWARPRIYVFDKNEIYLREFTKLDKLGHKKKVSTQKQITKTAKTTQKTSRNLDFPGNSKSAYGFRIKKKGKLNLAVYD